MKKAILFILCTFFTGALLMAQNEFGFSKEKMNGAFVHNVKTDNGKIIYAVDMSKLKSEGAVPAFMETLHSTDKVYPVSTVGNDKLLFIAGFTSVITEEQVKTLLLELKAKAEANVSSTQSKEKFSK